MFWPVPLLLLCFFLCAPVFATDPAKISYACLLEMVSQGADLLDVVKLREEGEIPFPWKTKAEETLASTRVKDRFIDPLFGLEYLPGRFGAKAIGFVGVEGDRALFWQSGEGSDHNEVHHHTVLSSLLPIQDPILEYAWGFQLTAKRNLFGHLEVTRLDVDSNFSNSKNAFTEKELLVGGRLLRLIYHSIEPKHPRMTVGAPKAMRYQGLLERESGLRIEFY